MSKIKESEKMNNNNSINLNDNQKDVFYYSFSKEKKNLLVSAAAGSGKTRVLVEKIIDMISNPKNEDKTTLDKMLIMTFTVKATYEMKSRIKKALEKKLREDSTSEDLIRESATIQNANITTIDAFCKKMVEEYYTELNSKKNSLYKDFDPSYRIADDKELAILYNNVLDEFLEKEVYKKDKKGNYIYDNFLQSYFKKNSDEKIREMLLDGIKFLSSLAWPLDELAKWQKNNNKTVSGTELKNLKKELNSKIEEISKDKGYKGKLAKIKFAIETAKNKNNTKSQSIIDDKTKKAADREEAKAELDKYNAKVEGYLDKVNLISGLYKVLCDEKLVVKKFIDEFLNNKTRVDGVFLTSGSSIALVKASTIGGGKENEEKYTDALDGIKAIFELFALKDRITEEEINLKFANNVNEDTYIELLKQFYTLTVKEKVRKNVYAIGDYANLTLDILYDDAHKKVSEFATKNIKNKYEYIFVDEYQDTNDIQEKIIGAISNGKNVFMVGDVKQSIYRFRNANPKIFVKNFDSYNKPNSKDGKVITMDINYRSSYKIIEFVNEIFKNSMTKDFGMIDYDPNGMLKVPDKNNSGLSVEEIKKREEGKEVEIYIVCDKKRMDETKKVKSLVPKMEAEAVAKRIIELYDGETIKYKDIVVLMRNPSSRVDFYMEAFAKHNIPCYLDMKKGFFNRVEIRFMVDILNVIDNDRQDIPLANVLTSDIIGITNQELAFIKYAHMATTENKHSRLVDDIDYFYNYKKYINDDKYAETIKKENADKVASLNEEAEKYIKKNKRKKEFDEGKYKAKIAKRVEDIKSREPKVIEQVGKFRDCCQETNKDSNGKAIVDLDTLGKKLEFYKNIFDKLRTKSRYLGISELINEVYSLTNIKNIMASMNDGIMRNANLDSLYEFAKDYEATSFVGLFNFMRYIEKIKKLDDDKGLAKTSDENDDVVRIMSIHASKGLEFKCVILTGCGSYYNRKDLERSVPVQFDSESGIAMDGYDLDKKYCIETKKKIDVKEKKDKESKEEEMRVLYVALTRAMERLIIIGGVHNTGQGAMSYKAAAAYYAYLVGEKDAKKVKAKSPSECKSYLELILSNYNSDTKNCKLKREEIDIDDTVTRVEDELTLKKIIDDKPKDSKAEKELTNEDKNKISILRRLNSDELKKNLDFKYKYSDFQKIDKAKMSVSDIKREKHKIELFEKLRISDMSNSKLYDNSEDIVDKAEKNCESMGLAEKLEDKEEKKFSTERGNAYHRYMQFYDYGKNKFTGNVGNGTIGDKPWIDIVNQNKIKAFLNTDLGKEMAEAFKNNELYREHKFMKLFSVDDINKYRNKIGNTPITINKELSSDHNIIIQGIIDAFYIKKDGNNEYAVLVDYKTDGLSSKSLKEKEFEEELKNEYKIQLDIYADVLKELTGLKVKHKYIYSFALDKAIDLEEK